MNRDSALDILAFAVGYRLMGADARRRQRSAPSRGLFEVPAAEPGAFFGLQLQSDGGLEVWVNDVHTSSSAWLAPIEHLSLRQADPLGMMRKLTD